MNIENNDVLRGWLREHGYAALAELPSFEVPQEEYEKHLADVRAQGLHSDEGANQARAVYRCLTTHLGGPEKRPEAQDSIATHLDRAARVFNQSVAVLAGKTDAHKQTIKKAVDDILEDSLSRHENISGRLRELSIAQAEAFDDLDLRIEGTFNAMRELTGQRVARLVWTIVLGFALVLALLGFMAVKGHAQERQPNGGRGNLAPTSAVAVKAQTKAENLAQIGGNKPDLGIPDAYLIMFRNLQFRQDKAVIRLKDFQLQEKQAKISADEAQGEIRSINEDIQRLAYGLAMEKHLDPAKWVLELDTLTWQPKPSEKKP